MVILDLALIKAIEAHGDTEKIGKWYIEYMPEFYKEYGVMTEVQYSCSCLFMEKVAKWANELYRLAYV